MITFTDNLRLESASDTVVIAPARGGAVGRPRPSGMSPADRMTATIAATVAEFAETRDDELSYTEISQILTAGWQVLNAVPLLVDERHEKRLQSIALGLDGLRRKTSDLDAAGPDIVAARGTEAKRRKPVLKLYSVGELSEGQREEYSALHLIPEGERRDARIEAFRSELAQAGIEALLTTDEDDAGPGCLIQPHKTTVYEIYYNHDYEGSTQRVYGDRECHRELYETFVGDAELEEHEILTQDEIDSGCGRFWNLIDTFFQELRGWVDYDVRPVDEPL